MPKNSIHLILFLTTALVLTIFAGCVTTPVSAPVQPNKYNSGDVVSDKQTEGYGVLILKYDPVNDVYTGRGVGKMEENWVWLSEKPITETRVNVENVDIYKTGYIPNSSVVGQL